MRRKILFFIFPLFLLMGNFCFAQDTIYVYEEEVVYDTVFVDQEKENLNLKNPKTEKQKEKTTSKLFQTSDPILFGVRLLGASKSHGFFRSIRDMHNLGYGGGIWMEKSFLNPQFSLFLSADFMNWNSNFSFDENSTTTQLTGYYFNEEGKPALFQSFSDKHSEFIGSLRGKYTYKKLSLSAGLNFSYYQLKMGFLIPENLRLTKLVDFKNNNFSVGYVGAIQYEFAKKFCFLLEYQANSYDDLEFKNDEFGSITFDIQNMKKIKDQKIIFGISYRFTK